jgi:hypothetical protein
LPLLISLLLLLLLLERRRRRHSPGVSDRRSQVRGQRRGLELAVAGELGLDGRDDRSERGLRGGPGRALEYPGDRCRVRARGAGDGRQLLERAGAADWIVFFFMWERVMFL